MPMSPRLLRPRATGFNPRSLSGLAVWLDASDASTLFQNSNATTAASATNDPIGCWANKAGPTNAIQTTNLNRPLYKPASQNGRGTIYLDGVNGFLTLGYDLASPFTLISAQKIEAATGAGFAAIGNLQNSGNFDGLLHCHASAVNTTTVATRMRIGATAYSTGAADAGVTWSTWVTTASGSTFRSRFNGVQLADGPAQTYSGRDSTISIGRSRTADASNVRALNMAEVLLYSRVLSATEIAVVERYLAAKWSIGQPPQVSNADAQDWINRVYINGGTVSTSTAAAVNTFCNSIDAAGIRDRFYRLNLFCGGNLSACLVPLYRGPSLGGTQFGNTTDTNTNFVSGDYVENGASGGLKGNGTNKRLDTGFPGNTLATGDRHLAAYESANATTDYSGSLHYFSSAVSRHWRLGPWTSSATYIYTAFTGVGGQPSFTKATGFIVGQNDSETAGSIYRNGSLVSSVTGGTANVLDASTVQVLGHSSGEFSEATLRGYSIGQRFTASQVAAYNTAMQAFQTALERNV